MANFEAATAPLRKAHGALAASPTPLAALADPIDALIARIGVLSGFLPPDAQDAATRDAARAAALDEARRAGYVVKTFNDRDSGVMWRVTGLDGASFVFRSW